MGQQIVMATAVLACWAILCVVLFRTSSASAFGLEHGALASLCVAAGLLGAEHFDPSLAVPKPVVLAVVLGMLVLCFAMLLMGKGTRKSAALRCPATSWPAGKPLLASPSDYPIYDYTRDPKGSFMKINDMLIADVKAELPTMYELPARENEWIERMLKYNTEGGKMTRGLMVVESAVLLFKAKGITIDNTAMCKFAVLGWCIEWLQAWLLVADDMMDESVTRRGQPCWYKSKTKQGNPVGTIAINDAVTIEALVFKILKRHFAKDECYVQLVDLMLETTFQTELGQLLDTMCDNLELSDFSLDRWQSIVTYKTAFYSFYLSVAFAMTYAGIEDPKAYDSARTILIKMGVYFQAQDDYLDCYGTPEQIGKIGTDIESKKCGFLFCNAYNGLTTPKITPAQKALLDSKYGKCKVGSEDEKAIKKLYDELNLKPLYEKYEQDAYDEIMALKATVTEVPWEVFEVFLHKIFKRKK
jgi:farnesyl diphosphate synthase